MPENAHITVCVIFETAYLANNVSYSGSQSFWSSYLFYDTPNTKLPCAIGCKNDKYANCFIKKINNKVIISTDCEPLA